MAVAYMMRFEGATLEQYDRVIELMGFTEGVGADGGVFHWSAKTDEGILVVDVWESDEQFNRFSHEHIGPITREAGVPHPPIVTRYDVHNTLVGPKYAASPA
jgi:hypothetical protein